MRAFVPVTGRAIIVAVVAALIGCVAAPAAARAGYTVPPGATWTQGTLPSTGGVRLHYDLLRPTGVPADAKLPVILSIGPYFGHAGQEGAYGAAAGEGYDPLSAPGPSDRFLDLITQGRLMERGYAFLMVDLRGFGGSDGCLDFFGPGEQADVKSAVEWAAAQPWSTGKVGMYGKSYDGATGLAGAIQNPKGLAAVVAQEPVYDAYRYLYAGGIRYLNSLLTPLLYTSVDATGFALGDGAPAVLNTLSSAGCYVPNLTAQALDDDHGSAFWRARDFIGRAAGAKVPLLLTQGFLENNTKPDGSFDFFSAYGGPKRAWFGMWDHVRGNDVDESDPKAPRLKMGRPGWIDEVMRFFDHYVRGASLQDAPVDRDPPVEVQTSDGTFRAEATWPPADATALRGGLADGRYTDDGLGAGSDGSGGQGHPGLLGHGIWTFSAPLAHDAHLAGIPVVTAQVTTSAPRANLVVDVYDVDPKGSAMIVSRGARRVDGSGRVTLPLYGIDWRFAAGHRVGVLVSGSNSDWWATVPTLREVSVAGASIALPWLRYTRTPDLAGTPALRLEELRESAPFDVDRATIDGATARDFPLPPAQTARPVAVAARPRIAALKLRRRSATSVLVSGTAPTGAKLVVDVRRGTRTTLARRTVTVRRGVFRIALRVQPRGTSPVRLRAFVSGTAGGVRLRQVRSGLVTLRRGRG